MAYKLDNQLDWTSIGTMDENFVTYFLDTNITNFNRIKLRFYGYLTIGQTIGEISFLTTTVNEYNHN